MMSKIRKGSVMARVGAAAAVVAAGVTTFGAAAGAAPTINNVGLVGPAAAGENTPVTSGSWSTPWDQDGYISGTTSGGVGFACPGTTLANGFEGWSYLVPDSPGVLSTLTFASGIGPTTPANGLPLLEASDGGPYAVPIDVVPSFDAQTAFDFSTFHDQGGWATTPTTGFLYPGTWDLGLACTNASNQLTTLFNTQIVITAAPTASDPNNFTFTVVPPATVPESPLTIALPIGAVALFAAAGAVVYRRRRTQVAA